MIRITQADIEAVTDQEVIALADEIVLNCHGNGNASVLIDRYRAELVAEIVAWLPEQPPHLSLQEYADAIEAKWGKV